MHREVVTHRPVFRNLAVDEPEGMDVLDIEGSAGRGNTVESNEVERSLEVSRPLCLGDYPVVVRDDLEWREMHIGEGAALGVDESGQKLRPVGDRPKVHELLVHQFGQYVERARVECLLPEPADNLDVCFCVVDTGRSGLGGLHGGTSYS